MSFLVRKNKRPSAHSLNSTGSSRSGSLTGDVTTTDPSKSQSHDNGDIEDGASSKDIKGKRIDIYSSGLPARMLFY